MRKLLTFLFVMSLGLFAANAVYAQDANNGQPATEETAQPAAEETAQPAEEAEVEPVAADAPVEEVKGFQLLKKYFIDGDPGFMSLVLIALILGLAFCIERIITLNIATTNTEKLLSRIDENLKSGNVDGAMEVCKSTQGPTASILYEGLKNAKQGPDAVEKAIVSYGSVQMGLLEKGLVWISLFIALAPMLGFLGTVIGMIQAFDKIEAVGDISPTVVAGGIKVALLTTVFGLVVAIILQLFYNYIVSKIDGIVNKMEDASIALVDIMAANNIFKK
ncbi:MAG: MotA/TolQ/ExbB proton channel family protein [Saprospiraceae bacterium]|nr:MotA/TolQ/ExbB proton channel family protein [Saprospiraceae bacterium]HRF40100.1 MotA/TolQ/ExbB proton channel family protein [Saprospiraceae bacterium]HRJ15134.1 MotA/TolQ/ExbB proton channel family protein [Saprospiraceae bacterium]HRK83620.1 MotA/TolQ/ExbB proton channel family protein [Saprospiraceae bacterium]